VHSVAVNEYADPIAESGAGITSDLVAHVLFGFSSPTYGSAAFPFVDAPVRLYAVPEPSLMAPLLACSTGLLLRRRRRQPLRQPA
jgi:hypothetical protein